MKKKCDCWVCSSALRSILKKLRGKERIWYEALIERCITAEDDACYWKNKNKALK